MEVRTISCSKKITVELAINVETIEYKSSSIHGHSFELPFSISVGDGSNYHGKIVFSKTTGNLSCYIYDVKDLTGNISMTISQRKTHIAMYNKVLDIGETQISNAKRLYTKVGADYVTFLKGSFTITFEPNEKKIMEEGLINFFSLLKQDQLEGPNDVTLAVQGKNFEFNMSYLAKISTVFKDLSTNCSSGDKKIPITNDVTTVQTMETFQKILVQKSVELQEITVDLLKFANFYDIQPLVKFCGDHLGSKINTENVLEIAMAADLVDHEELFKKTAYFLKLNPEIDMNSLKNNPEFGVKLFLAMRK